MPVMTSGNGMVPYDVPGTTQKLAAFAIAKCLPEDQERQHMLNAAQRQVLQISGSARACWKACWMTQGMSMALRRMSKS